MLLPWIPLWANLVAAQSPTTFAIRVSIAPGDSGAPVAAAEWLAEEVAQAQQLFAPFGVAFTRQEGPPLGAAAQHLETRADRDALAARVAPHVVNVFIVGSLRDVDEPDRMRRGVHWHAPSRAHYVIVVASAPPSVLAHELGHFFGNPHSPVPDNIMSYERTGGAVAFDEAQGERIVRQARAYVKTGELVPVQP